MEQNLGSEVIAQGAAGALAAAVDLAFGAAGSAGEVARDAGAGQADRARVGAVLAAGQHPVVSAAGAEPWVRIAV